MNEEKELDSKNRIEEETVSDFETINNEEESDTCSLEEVADWSGISKGLTSINAVKISAINSGFTTVANSFDSMVKMPKINDPALKAMVRANESMKKLTGATEAMKHIVDNSAVKAFSEIAIKNVIPQYTFKSAALEHIGYSMANTLKQFSDRLSYGLTHEIAEYMGKAFSKQFPSPAMKWILLLN